MGRSFTVSALNLSREGNRRLLIQYPLSFVSWTLVSGTSVWFKPRLWITVLLEDLHTPKSSLSSPTSSGTLPKTKERNNKNPVLLDYTSLLKDTEPNQETKTLGNSGTRRVVPFVVTNLVGLVSNPGPTLTSHVHVHFLRGGPKLKVTIAEKIKSRR